MPNIQPVCGVDQKTVASFAALELIYWGIMGSFGAYFVAWMLHIGYAQSFVSILLILYLLSGMTGQFVLSGLCDRLRTNKRVFLFGVTAAAAAQLGMYFSKSTWMLVACYACYGFFLGPMGSVLDAWMLRSFWGNMKVYSPVRGAGSVGYAVIILTVGYLIGGFGYHMMPICSSVIAAATLLLASTVPDAPFPKQEKGEGRISGREIFAVLRAPAFSAILLLLVLTSMTSMPIANFKIVLLQSVGGDVTVQGVDSFAGCLVQFLTFEAAALVARFSARNRFYASIALVSLSLAVNYWAGSCAMVIAATMLTNASYGLLMPAVRELAIGMVDPRYHTTAIGLMDASYSFLGGAAAQLYVGRVAESQGIRAMVLLCLLLSFLPLLIIAWKEILTKRKRREQNVWITGQKECCSNCLCCGEHRGRLP